MIFILLKNVNKLPSTQLQNRYHQRLIASYHKFRSNEVVPDNAMKISPALLGAPLEHILQAGEQSAATFGLSAANAQPRRPPLELAGIHRLRMKDSCDGFHAFHDYFSCWQSRLDLVGARVAAHAEYTLVQLYIEYSFVVFNINFIF